jgi:high-affinity iron transporter
MLPAFLITFREVIEATLIVATLLGVFIRLDRKRDIRGVWVGAASAFIAILLILILAAMTGFRIRNLFTGRAEEVIEGTLMIITSGFITWAVFSLHRYFAGYKTRLLGTMRDVIDGGSSAGIIWLAFTAVFREGIEIALFLTTIYFSEDPVSIFSGFAAGILAGVLLCVLIIVTSIRIPIFQMFRMTGIALILFGAGLLARGIHEFSELGIIPDLGTVRIFPVRFDTHIMADMTKSVFGISATMEVVTLMLYLTYVWFMMRRFVVIRHARQVGDI